MWSAALLGLHTCKYPWIPKPWGWIHVITNNRIKLCFKNLGLLVGLSSRAQLASLSTKAVSVLSAGWRCLHRPTPSRERRSCRAVPVAGVPYGLGVDIQWSLPSRGKRSLDSCQAGTETTLDLCKRHPAWFGPSALLNNHLLLGVIFHSLAPSTSTSSCCGDPSAQPSPTGHAEHTAAASFAH